MPRSTPDLSARRKLTVGLRPGGALTSELKNGTTLPEVGGAPATASSSTVRRRRTTTSKPSDAVRLQVQSDPAAPPNDPGRPLQAPPVQPTSGRTTVDEATKSGVAESVHVVSVPVELTLRASTAPVLVVVCGLAAIFVSETASAIVRGMSFQAFGGDALVVLGQLLLIAVGWLAPLLITFGLWSQAAQLARATLQHLDALATHAERLSSRELPEKLDILAQSTDICDRALNDNRSSRILYAALLIIALLIAVGGQVVQNFFFDFGQVSLSGLILRLIAVDGPPIAAVAGMLGLLWSADLWFKLRTRAQYIRRQTNESIAKKRILDRFESKYFEFADLSQKIAKFVEQNEQLAVAYNKRNNLLLLVGIVLSAMITTVGIFGSAGLLKFGANDYGSVASALLGVIVAAVIAIQNTFKMQERAMFQKQIASEGRALHEELLFNVLDDLEFRSVLTRFQRLYERTAREFPTSRQPEQHVDRETDKAGQRKGD